MNEELVYSSVNTILSRESRDIWSFGCLVVQMETPFRTTTPRTVLSLGWRNRNGRVEFCNVMGSTDTVRMFFEIVRSSLGYQPTITQIGVPVGTIYTSLV